VKARCFLVGFVNRNLQEWLRCAQELVRVSPADPTAHNMLGIVYVNLGLYEEAYQSYRRACELGPFGPHTFHVYNQFRALTALGRYEEAARVAESLSGMAADETRLKLLMAKHDWDRAEALANEYVANPASPDRVKWKAGWALASVFIARGELRRAGRALAAMHDRYGEQGQCFVRVFLRRMTGDDVDAMSSLRCSQALTDNALLRGIYASAKRDTTTASECLRELQRQVVSDDVFAEPKLLKGWIAADQEDWEEVIRNLEPATTQGADWAMDRHAVQWLVAEAFEMLGDSARAADYYTRVTNSVSYAGEESCGLPYSFAHHRLVLLYSKMGRVEDARRHWEIFEKTFTNPDPELVPMVEEARRALEEAEEKAAL